MPIPVTKDVGKTVRFLKHDKPGMSHKQKIAIALSIARKAGAHVAKKGAVAGALSRAKK